MDPPEYPGAAAYLAAYKTVFDGRQLFSRRASPEVVIYVFAGKGVNNAPADLHNPLSVNGCIW